MSPHPLRFVTPGDHRELTYEGDCGPDGRWTDGVLRTIEEDVTLGVQDGIPRFLSDDATDAASEKEMIEYLRESRGISPDEMIEHNFRSVLHYDITPHKEAFQSILEKGGPIIDLACGPGGGITPKLLELDPNALVLMNDIEIWPLRQWQRFARRKVCWPNVCFAQFDATAMPIASDSVAAAVSWWGISSVMESREESLREVFRILRPGGRLCGEESVSELLITPESSIDAIQAHRIRFQPIDYGTVLSDIGFGQVKTRPISWRHPIHGEGGIADFAEEHNVEVRMWNHAIEAVKPE